MRIFIVKRLCQKSLSILNKKCNFQQMSAKGAKSTKNRKKKVCKSLTTYYRASSSCISITYKLKKVVSTFFVCKIVCNSMQVVSAHLYKGYYL